MKELIWEHTANGITTMWYRMKAWPHQQRRGFKYTIERVYINHTTGKIETSYHHTKN
jgi:hypothetical protein